MRTSHIVGWSVLALYCSPFDLGAGRQHATVSVTVLNGLTLASLYFIVASGFTLVFGLMRNVNLAHGSLYLLGGYVGFIVAEKTGFWVLALAAGFFSAAIVGLLIQTVILRHMQGQDLRQTMVTIGLSILIADVLLWVFSAEVHQMEAPEWLKGPIRGIPIINAYSAYRMSLLVLGVAIGVALWLFLNRTRVGMMIRAGVDDRAMLAASGVNVNLVFAITFAIGAGLAGLGGVIGAVELSMVPGEDTRFLLASLIVVIVGGMGSVAGAAIGAAMLGLAETFGLAYAPTYSVVFTFVILVIVLAFRPRGLMGRPQMGAANGGACNDCWLAGAGRGASAHLQLVASAPQRAQARGDGCLPCAGGLQSVAVATRCACRLYCFSVLVSPFIKFQIGAQTLALGLIALSLTFWVGYGGMVSLAQMTVAASPVTRSPSSV